MRLGRGEILILNLIRRLIQNHRLEIRVIGNLQNRIHHLQHGQRFIESKVIGLPAMRVGIFVQRFGESEIGVDGIFHVKIVALHRAIGAHDGRLVEQRRAHCPRHDSIPIKIAAAIHIGATSHGGIHAIRMGKGAHDQIGARLRNIIRMFALQRRIFGVWQNFMRAIGFVA